MDSSSSSVGDQLQHHPFGVRKSASSQDEHVVDPKRIRTRGCSNQALSSSSAPSMPQHSAPQSPDDILTQMILDSGAQTPVQVVEFCRSAGIPLSRMLRLDLLGQLPPPSSQQPQPQDSSSSCMDTS